MKKIFFILFVSMLCTSLFAQKNIHREDIEWCNSWMVNVNSNDLPHVLLIGNSITGMYVGDVEKALKGKAYCSRLTTSKSLGDPNYLKEVEMALQHNTYKIIHFNNGLHGSQYTEDEYMRDFSKLITLFKKYSPEAKLVWATITPTRDATDLKKYGGFNDRVKERNKRVKAFLQKNKSIYVDDLNSLLLDKPELYSKDGTHPNAEGASILSKQVSEILLNLLSE